MPLLVWKVFFWGFMRLYWSLPWCKFFCGGRCFPLFTLFHTTSYRPHVHPLFLFLFPLHSCQLKPTWMLWWKSGHYRCWRRLQNRRCFFIVTSRTKLNEGSSSVCANILCNLTSFLISSSHGRQVVKLALRWQRTLSGKPKSWWQFGQNPFAGMLACRLESIAVSQ